MSIRSEPSISIERGKSKVNLQGKEAIDAVKGPVKFLLVCVGVAIVATPIAAAIYFLVWRLH